MPVSHAEGRRKGSEKGVGVEQKREKDLSRRSHDQKDISDQWDGMGEARATEWAVTEPRRKFPLARAVKLS